MDIVIVGGGVVGTAAAARLADTGHTVTLLEQDELGSGTTATSAAVFTWQQPQPNRFDHALRKQAWETYGPLVEADAVSFERVGALYVADSEVFAATLQDAAGTLREYGLDSTFVEPEDLPMHGIASDDHYGGLHTPEEGYFDPDELVKYFAGEAADVGAEIHEDVAVVDIRTDDGQAVGVETTDRLRPADAIVNAAGPWAPFVNEMAGVSMPLRHTFGPILVLEADASVSLPFTLFESKYYVRPHGDRHAFLGRYETDYADGETLDPDDVRGVNDAFRTEVWNLIDTVLPSLSGSDVADEWVGLRTVTPDGRPVIGEATVSGFHLACGMSGHGVTLAPVVADVLANHVDGGTMPSELAPDRFADREV
jgi:sarcosine oxidase subunit beta